MIYSKRAKIGAIVSLSIGVLFAIGTMFNTNATDGDDKIHFINVGNSEAILIESNNKFGLIDTGLNDETEIVEHEKVLDYLNNVARDKDGIVNLDFIVATHPDKNSIGGLSEIISAKNINVSKVFLEEYESATKRVRLLEDEENLKSYYNLVNTITNKKIERISNVNSEDVYRLGDFKITFINTLAEKEKITFLEDSNSSIAVKVENKYNSALISGGLNNIYMDEGRVASQIGNVDLLVLGENGNKTSSTEPFLNVLSPSKCILSGENKNINPEMYSFIKGLNSNIYSTQDNGNIVATFSDGHINLNSEKAINGGWYQDFHKTYYYNEKGELLTGINRINDKLYLFDENGLLSSGWIRLENGNIAYADNNGVIQTGLTNINVNDEDKIYYFDKNGYLLTGWQFINDNWYYFEENNESDNYGSALKGLQTIVYDNYPRIFMFDENGIMKKGLTEIDNKYYYFNDNPERGVIGEMIKGIHQLIINNVDDLYDFGDDGVLKWN